MSSIEQKFLESYEAHSDPLFRFAYFQISDREVSKDIIQDVFMETWKYLTKGGEIENMRAFLYRSARNRIIDHYRRHTSQSLDAIIEEGLDVCDEEGRDVSEMRAETSHMLRLLEKLDTKYREPVLLRYMEGMGVKEIAGILGESESNASVLIHRGLEQLKKLAHV